MTRKGGKRKLDRRVLAQTGTAKRRGGQVSDLDLYPMKIVAYLIRPEFEPNCEFSYRKAPVQVEMTMR